MTVDMLLPPDDPGPVKGTWKATAKGHHQQYRGEIELVAADAIDLTPVFDRLLTRRAQKNSEQTDK